MFWQIPRQDVACAASATWATPASWTLVSSACCTMLAWRSTSWRMTSWHQSLWQAGLGASSTRRGVASTRCCIPRSSKRHWAWCMASLGIIGRLVEIVALTPSLRRPCIHAIFFPTHVGQRVNTHSVFWESCRKPCQHATRGCDKRWMTCIHAGVSWSPREHASVPPDKRHCCQGMSEWNGMSEWIFA